MQQVYTAAELAAQIAALRQMFDEVLLVDTDTATTLDPATLAHTGTAHTVPTLDAHGRGWQPLLLASSGETALFFYQAVQVEGRPCVLAAGYALPQTAEGDRREVNAFQRMLQQYRDELYRDFVTGAYNRRYLDEVCRHRAAALAAEHPVSAVVARVHEYAALCEAENAAAADSCLNAAAGLLRTGIDPAWKAATLARLEDGIFVVAAAVERQQLEAALRDAAQHSRRRFNITLARRGQFTMDLASADWAETGSWEAMIALAGDRLQHAEN